MAVIGEMRQLTIGGKTYTIPTYSLPIASSSVLGGIKVGSGLSIDPSTGTLTATGTSITIDTAMSDSSTNAVQNKVIKSYADGLIAALDGGTIGTPGAGKTLTALSQTNGQVSATFSNISITKSQVSDFPTNVSAFTNDAGYTTNTGTVTSVRVQATSPVQSSTSTAQSATLNTTISLADAYGDTKNPYGSKTKNYVLAAPSNAAGAPTFRALVAADIPDLSSIYLTSYTETDPTVPAWAKASSKPTYTASEVGAATSDHTHGNITNGGDITATAPTIANGDQIVINDASASKITNGPTFDGSTTSKYLSQKGTWESLPQGTAYSAGTGLSLSGTTFNHSNSVTAQTTQAVYPIKIDAQGHISAYGSAVTIVNTRGTATSGGTTLSVVNTGDMYTWNNKSDTDEKVKQESLNGTNSGKNFLFTSSLQTTNSVTGTITYGRYITYNDYAQTLTLTYNNDSTKSLSLGYNHLSIKNGTYSIYLYTNTPTANRQIYLPDKAGTIALTSDIPDISNKADKATTLAGYGITDAKIANGTITLGSNTITPLTSFTETDPTVPSWAKASSKPSYNFSEIGSKPTTLAGYGITDGVSSSTTAKIFVQSSAPTSGMVAGDIWIDTSGLS